MPPERHALGFRDERIVYPYCLYGEPANGLSNHLVCPVNSSSVGPLTPEMADFNKRMSHCRVSVEWGFKEMTGKWAFVNMKPQQKFLLSPVAKHVGPLTPEMADFNKRMSHCRVSVEWGFKEMTGKWAFVNMKPQQKFLLSPVAKQ
ncbi:unnamed protein product [Ectocarpus sp. CCAP 1310/34]|nr:unnamed protein product [Ectocarpus sp. CCAP 1310/34]